MPGEIIGNLFIEQHGFGQLFSDFHDGIQAGKRILKDHAAVFKIFCKVATVTDERFPEPEVGACRKRQTQPPRQRPGLGRLPGKC